MPGACNHRLTGKQPRPVRQKFTKFAQASTAASKFRLIGKQKPQLFGISKKTHQNYPCAASERPRAGDSTTGSLPCSTEVQTHGRQESLKDMLDIQSRQKLFVQALEKAGDDAQQFDAPEGSVRHRLVQPNATRTTQDAPSIARTLLAERPIQELQILCTQDGLSDQGTHDELTERVIQHYIERSRSIAGSASEPAPGATAATTESAKMSKANAPILVARGVSENPACTDIPCGVVDNLMDLVDRCGSPQVAQELVDCVAADDAASQQTRAAVRLALEHLTAYFNAERQEVLDNIGMLSQLCVPTDIARPQMAAASMSLRPGELALEVGSPTPAMQAHADHQHILCPADNICSSSPLDNVVPSTGSADMMSDEHEEDQVASRGGEEDSTAVALIPEMPKFPFGSNDFVEDLDVWIQRSLHRLQ